jgi:hypothetical protein
MNKLQKQILVNFAVVMLVTVTAIVGMVELKNIVNRSESMRAIEQLQKAVAAYKQKNGSVPSEAYVDGIIKTFDGQPRLGNLKYRARWIGFDSSPDAVLAYVKKEYHSLFSRPGAIVLLFDGRIEWMDKANFDKLIASQQTQLELEMTPK